MRTLLLLSILLTSCSLYTRSDVNKEALGNKSSYSLPGPKLEQYKNFWENPVWNSKYQPNLGKTEKLAGLSRLWMEVKYNFAYFDQVPNLNWDKLYFEYLEKVQQTKSTFEYYRLLQKLSAKLEDGHTGVYPPKELFKQFYSKPALRTSLIDKRVILTEVEDENLKKAGIHRGLELTHIDSIPVKKYAAKSVIPYISASTEQSLFVHAYDYRLLSGTEG